MLPITCSKCQRIFNVVFGRVTDIVCQGCGGQTFTLGGVRTANFLCSHCGKNIRAEGGIFKSPCPGCGGRKFIYGLGDDLSKLIVFIRNRGLGDVLMTTVAVRELKKEYPESKICYACDPDMAPLLKGNPNVDYVIGEVSHGRKVEKFWKKIDLVESVEDYKRDGMINRKNRIIRFLELSGIYKGQQGPMVPDYFVSEDEGEWADEVLCSKRKAIAFVMDAAAPYRSWLEIHYQTLSRMFDKSKYDLLLIAGRNMATDWFGSGIINSTGRLTIRQMGALISRCSLVIAGDTGPGHLAAALDVPSILFYGAIPPEARCVGMYPKAYPMYEPNAAPCIPCWDIQEGKGMEMKRCRDEGAMCMKAITPEKVYKKAMTILERGKK